MAVNIEKLFHEVVKEQKHKAFLNKARTGKKGSSKGRKGVLTPYDTMSKKEKRKLNGEVTVTMYETVLTKQEFAMKDESMQVLMLTRWREIYDNHTIRTQMGLTNKDYYDLVAKLKIPKKKRTEVLQRARERKATLKVEREANKKQEPEEIVELELETTTTNHKPEIHVPEVIKQEPAPPEVKPMLISRGLHLEYNGEYTAEQIVKIFTKLQVLTEGEENTFNLAISLTERV